MKLTKHWRRNPPAWAIEAAGRYEEGQSADEICDALGVHRTTLYAALKAQGVPTRQKRRPAVKVEPKEPESPPAQVQAWQSFCFSA